MEDGAFYIGLDDKSRPGATLAFQVTIQQVLFTPTGDRILRTDLDKAQGYAALKAYVESNA